MPDHTLDIFYRTAGKALPPQPIRLTFPDWGGLAEKKMEHGSEPQPWHCRPYVQGAIYGVELVYQYEMECHVINDSGKLRIEWDYAREPGGVVGRDEFGFGENQNPQFYSFASSIDLQAPPGYVLQAQPHPRFFTDDTGTVPIAVTGQVQSEWWPKKLFNVFKVPPPGGKHIFRKGEPYVQIIFVPAKPKLALKRMSPEAEKKREAMEADILYAKSHVAKNIWCNPTGGHFDDHYKVLERIFASHGAAGVEEAIAAAVAKQRQTLPEGLSFTQYLDLAQQHFKEGKLIEARDVYFHLRRLEPGNPQVANGLGMVAAGLGLFDLAVQAMSFAVATEPRSSVYRSNLGAVLLQSGKTPEAELCLRAALALDPANRDVMASLSSLQAGKGS